MTKEMLQLSAPEKSIPALLEMSGEPVHEHIIAAVTDTKLHDVRNVLTPMIIEGRVEETEECHYRIAE